MPTRYPHIRRGKKDPLTKHRARAPRSHKPRAPRQHAPHPKKAHAPKHHTSRAKHSAHKGAHHAASHHRPGKVHHYQLVYGATPGSAELVEIKAPRGLGKGGHRAHLPHVKRGRGRATGSHTTHHRTAKGHSTGPRTGHHTTRKTAAPKPFTETMSFFGTSSGPPRIPKPPAPRLGLVKSYAPYPHGIP
jgi:hypothetical protein